MSHDVGTVAELTELPEGSLVIGRDGRSWLRTNKQTAPWRCSDGSGYASYPEDLTNSCERFLRYEGPLKVVWVP